MGYMRAEEVLPEDVIELIQKYVDGQSIYIPKKSEKRKTWGTKTGLKAELRMRNELIYKEYLSGKGMAELSGKYFLTEKSIRRIVCEMNREEQNHGH